MTIQDDPLIRLIDAQLAALRGSALEGLPISDADRGRALAAVFAAAAGGDVAAVARLEDARRMIPNLPLSAAGGASPVSATASAGPSVPAEDERTGGPGWFAPPHSAAVSAPAVPEAPEGASVSEPGEATVVAPPPPGRMGGPSATPDEAMPLPAAEMTWEARLAMSVDTVPAAGPPRLSVTAEWDSVAPLKANYFETAPDTLGMREGETPRQLKVRKWRNRQIGEEAERVFAAGQLSEYDKGCGWMARR